MGVRFAPSPTGRFHLGNLRTAWISHLWAKSLGVPWVVRFEDIDSPRVVAGAQEQQLRDLETLGMIPDEIRIQSQSARRHHELFERARKEGAIYPCTCSRKEVQEALAQAVSAPHREVPIYPGQCRNRKTAPDSKDALAWRFRAPDESGAQDFIVARACADGSGFVPAYHWACAIDDSDGDYRLLVRAWDLSPAAFQQRLIHAWLSEVERAKPFPAIFHAALVTANDRSRLEKRTRGVTLPDLLESGISSAVIVERFRRGAAMRTSDFVPEGISGESTRTLTLSQIGF